MDEILFRSSQRLENLQYQLSVAGSHGKDAIFQMSTEVKNFLSRIVHTNKAEQIQENVKELWLALISLARNVHAKFFVYIDPHNIYESVSKLINKQWTKRDFCFGFVGFLIGGALGLCVGMAIQKRPPQIRSMHAIQCINYSGLESVCVVEDAKAPSACGKNEVLINVKAASVQSIDAKICSGYGRTIRRLLSKYFKHNSSDLPLTLGRDCTGIISDIGRNITRLELGDEVWLAVPFWAPGTLSQYVSVPEEYVSHKPNHIGFEAGCSLPYAGGVALEALREADLSENTAKNKRIFINGGCTPVGCVLIQLLNFWEANVITTCYKRAVPVVKALGAEEVVTLDEENHKNKSPGDNFSAQVKDKNILLKELELRGPFDVIIITSDCNLDKEDFAKISSKDCHILSTVPENLTSDSYGFIMRTFFTFYIRTKCFFQGIFGSQIGNFGETHICYETLNQISKYVQNGTIQTVVDKVYHPNDIEKALNHIQSAESIGSTVITFR